MSGVYSIFYFFIYIFSCFKSHRTPILTTSASLSEKNWVNSFKINAMNIAFTYTKCVTTLIV